MKNFATLQKLEYSRKSINEIALLITTHKGFKMIVETPNSQPHLNLFFPFESSASVQDRAKMGDCKKSQTFCF